MKQDISNKHLASLLVVAIVISLGGTWMVLKQDSIEITGLQSSTDTGTAQLTIASAGGIRFAVDTVNFGSGRVNTSGGNQVCVLDTNGTNDSSRCINFTANTVGFQIENDGSANASVELLFSNNATGFIGGSDSLNEYRYVVSQNETDSCRNSTGGTGCIAGINCTISPIGWSDVNITTPGTLICPKLLFSDLTDSLQIDINVSIPYDTPSGAKTSTLTATATSVS